MIGKYKKIKKKIEAKNVWSTLVFKSAEDFSFDKNDVFKDVPALILNSKKIRTKIPRTNTIADPFLFVDDDTVYLLYERKQNYQKGVICCVSTENFIEFRDHGIILKGDFHISYPMVFRNNDKILMIPETSEIGNVSLYEFGKFPHGLKKVKNLLDGNYADTTIVKICDVWYLFSTKDGNLHLFFADDIYSGKLKEHPCSPVSKDKRFSRCGGGIIVNQEGIFRVAQNCENEYGEFINILKINEINKENFSEDIMIYNYPGCKFWWNMRGTHHLSVAKFKDKNIIAIDGRHADYFLNLITAPFFNLMNKINNRLCKLSNKKI